MVVIAIVAAVAPSLLPIGDRLGGDGRRVAAIVIFFGSYLALAIGRIPGLSIDRAGIALVGASLMVASDALSLEDAYKAIDLDTITLLLGIMIVVASLRLSGFFAIATTPGSPARALCRRRLARPDQPGHRCRASSLSLMMRTVIPDTSSPGLEGCHC